MKVFVINLDKDKDRMASIDAQLKGLGVQYERISGVYAKNLPGQERKCFVNNFRWWCAVGRPISPAEIGCAMSHYGIYKRMIDEGISRCCILEDDIRLDKRFVSVLDGVERWMDTGSPQVILLSNHTNMDVIHNGVVRYDENGLTVVENETGMCTDGYCINIKAAESLLRQNTPLITPCDHWWRWTQNRTIRLFHILPSVVAQAQYVFGSGTMVGRERVSDYPLCRYVLHKGCRVFGRTVDVILRFIFGR